MRMMCGLVVVAVMAAQAPALTVKVVDPNGVAPDVVVFSEDLEGYTGFRPDPCAPWVVVSDYDWCMYDETWGTVWVETAEYPPDPAAAQAALREQAAAALVTVPPDGAAVTITGDALYPRFYRAGVLLESVVYGHVDRLAGRPEAVRIVEEPIFALGPRTEFDLYAPGIILFGLLMIIPQTAMLVAREIRWDTLPRLRLTRIRAWDLLGGISIAQMIVEDEHLVESAATAVAGLPALAAAAALYDGAAVDAVHGEELGDLVFHRHLLLAGGAYAPHESLGEDGVDGGGDKERLDADVDQPGDG